jgi:Fe2+ or Zn2+ uptake regulation protein
MSREQRIVDTETGEILSSRKIKSNANFVQFYRNEIGSIRDLIKDEPKAASLFLFLSEKMDQENALIVSQETLSEYFGISKRTIIRQLNVLKEKGFIEIIKSGTANVYLVNANIAWTSYANKREYAQFKANVFVSKTEQTYSVKETKFKQLDLLDSDKQKE